MSVAGVAHPVERHLAKVEVASSSLVTRSIKKKQMCKHLLLFCFAVTVSQKNARVRWTLARRSIFPNQSCKEGRTTVRPSFSSCTIRSLLPQSVKYLHQRSGIEIRSCSKVQGKPKEAELNKCIKIHNH